MKTHILLTLWCLLGLGFCMDAKAQSSSSSGTTTTNPTISYQGTLATDRGIPVDSGTYSITVSLYSDEQGKSVVWQDTFDALVIHGTFNLQLGSQRPLPEPDRMAKAGWAGIQVNGSPQATALTKLGVVPFAMNVADNSITPEKMATSYVGEIRVNGERVMSKGGLLNLQSGEGTRLTYDSTTNSVKIEVPTPTVVLSGGLTPGAGNGCTTNSDGGVGYNTIVGGCTNIIYTTGVTTTNNSYSSIGGGQNNTIQSAGTGHDASFSAIAGGAQNLIEAKGNNDAQYSFIGAGQLNHVWDFSTFVGAGDSNIISEEYSAIVNGKHNTIYGVASFIGSGEQNRLGYETDEERVHHNVIAGGLMNTLDPTLASSTEENGYNFIGSGVKNRLAGPSMGASIVGGDTNMITAGTAATIVGGQGNKIDGASGTALGAIIGGGVQNQITGSINLSNSVIAGGTANGESSSLSFIGGGAHNSVDKSRGVIGGGQKNYVSNYAGTIAGGDTNSVSGDRGFVGGGEHNVAIGSRSVVGGGSRNRAEDLLSTIAGGDTNTIEAGFGARSFIGGGDSNVISGAVSVIGGGAQNIITYTGDYSTIGGGRSNRIEGPSSVISGGDSNKIVAALADHNFIGGGLGNIEANPSFGVIGGGWTNYLDTNSWASTIAGGGYNTIRASRGFVGGGWYNTIEIYDLFSAIAGGESNRVWAEHAFLGGGYKNFQHGPFGSIVGGDSNTNQSFYGFVGGGYQNTIDYNSDTATLVGGAKNYIGFGRYSFLGAGYQDTSWASFTVLGGGAQNKIMYNANYSLLGAGFSNLIAVPDNHYRFDIPGQTLDSTYDRGYVFLGAGRGNTIKSSYATLGGGYGNTVDSNALFAGLLGGHYNNVQSPLSFIGGGFANTVQGAAGDVIVGGWENSIVGNVETKDFIGGGELNSLQKACWSVIGGGLNNNILSSVVVINGNSANWDVIGGGENNTIDTAEHASITGGLNNLISSNGQMASISGGDHLIAQSYAQFVTGRFNLPLGSSTNVNPQDTDALAIFGNGSDLTHRKNAAVLSNSGYWMTAGEANTGGATFGATGNGVRIGTTYKDNTIAAWGQVSAAGTSTLADVGVQKVVHTPGSGLYTIVLRTLNQDGSSFAYSTHNCAIVASVEQNATGAPGIITVSPIIGSSNTFTITTWKLSPSVVPDDNFGFMFHVILKQ